METETHVRIAPSRKDKPIPSGTLVVMDREMAMVPSDRAARIFVWSVWSIMMIVAMVSLLLYTKNFPRDEDWFLVPALTGNESNLAGWVWAQQENSEHRVPFPRIILLIVLFITQGNFKAGGVLNIMILGALALAMIITARKLRNRTTFPDAFFPIAFLHLGHSENLFWGWQLTQVLPTTLACCILLIIVIGHPVINPIAAVLAGVSLILLPLNGGNGLLYVPLLALWLLYFGAQQWRENRRDPKRGLAALSLIVSGALALGLTGLYFVGFEHRSWYAPPSTLTFWLETTIKFLAMAFGPIARSSWILSVTAMTAILLVTIVLTLRGALLQEGTEKRRAIGILIFVATIAQFALATSWGRAEAISQMFGFWPIRYALFAVPMLCAGFLVSELYASFRFRRLFQSSLFCIVLVLVPLNTLHGWNWTNWFLERHTALEQDLTSGTAVKELVERHRAVLISWMEPGRVADLIRMLRTAGYQPFASLVASPNDAGTKSAVNGTSQERSVAEPKVDPGKRSYVTQELRYIMPEAGEVYLVWGINGWQILPESQRPHGTSVQDNVMRTPMVHDGRIFSTQLALSPGTSVDYCFLITKKRDSFDITWPLCEGDHHEQIAGEGVREITSRTSLSTVTQEIRYRAPEAKEVYLVWGLNGWHVAPDVLRPAGTALKNKVMHTPMLLSGDTFTATVSVPTGTTVDYGFQITKRHGLFDIVYPVFDGNYTTRVVKDGRIDIQAKAGLFP
jgi:hypothetical protein